MVSILLPALVAVLGMLVYALSANGKVAELGRIAFFCGLLVAVWTASGERFHLP